VKHQVNIIIAIVFIVMSSMASESAPTPLWEFKLNEGKGIIIANAGSKQGEGELRNPEKTEWGPGRESGKTLYLKNDVDGKSKGKHAGVSIPNPGIVDFSKSFTVSAWILPDKVLNPSKTYQILGDLTSDSGPGFRLIYGWNTLRLTGGDGEKAVSISTNNSKNPFMRDVWQHVAATYDANKKVARIYLNGALAAESLEMFTLYKTKRSHFYIGFYGDGYCDGWNGAISDVKIFDQALTHGQILIDAQGILIP